MKYFEITLHDNDFFLELDELGTYLTSKIAAYYDVFDINDNRKKLTDGMIKFLSAVYHLNKVIRYGDVQDAENMTEYFKKHLSVNVVDKSDIPTNCNSENLYVPICSAYDIAHGVSYFIV